MAVMTGRAVLPLAVRASGDTISHVEIGQVEVTVPIESIELDADGRAVAVMETA